MALRYERAVIAGLITSTLVIALSGATLIGLQRGLGAREQQTMLWGWIGQIVGFAGNQFFVAKVYGYSDSVAFFKKAEYVWVDVRLDPAGMLPELVYLLLGMETLLEVGGSSGTATMVALATPTIPLLGDNFMATSSFFAMLSFVGKGLLYHAFRPLLQARDRVLVLFACFLVPTSLYWTGGLIKEAVVITGIGFVAFGLSRARTSPIMLLLVPFPFYIVALIKPHFILTGLIAMGGWFYWSGAVRRGQIEVRPTRVLLAAAIAMAGIVIAGQISPRLALENLVDETATLQDKGNKGGSAYSLGAGQGLTGQLAVLPLALLTGLYRPTLFDVRNAQTLMNALETLAFLIYSIRAVATIRREGVRRFVENPFLLFCLVFAVTSAAGIGLASANLGSLSRYRSPLIPFFVIVLAVLTRAPAKAVARVPAARGRLAAR